jgi:hypothetical protein
LVSLPSAFSKASTISKISKSAIDSIQNLACDYHHSKIHLLPSVQAFTLGTMVDNTTIMIKSKLKMPWFFKSFTRAMNFQRRMDEVERAGLKVRTRFLLMTWMSALLHTSRNNEKFCNCTLLRSREFDLGSSCSTTQRCVTNIYLPNKYKITKKNLSTDPRLKSH